MFLRCLSMLAFVALLMPSAMARDLRVCVDPDNLPFSNSKGEGYENRLVSMLGKALATTVINVWWNDRRMPALEALQKNKCDFVPGTLFQSLDVLTTQPYLRSTYAFVKRADDEPIAGFNDTRLKSLKIGVQSIGDDAVAPPVSALLKRGLGSTIRAYTLHGNYSDPNSAGGIVKAVAAGDIDAAILWGPLAGYFASRQRVPLVVSPMTADPTDPPMAYSISMAVRRDDPVLLAAVNAVLKERQAEIKSLLMEYHVPMLPSNLAAFSP